MVKLIKKTFHSTIFCTFSVVHFCNITHASSAETEGTFSTDHHSSSAAVADTIEALTNSQIARSLALGQKRDGNDGGALETLTDAFESTCLHLYEVTRTCKVLYELKAPDEALRLIRLAHRHYKPTSYIFEVKQLLEVLSTHHSESADLINFFADQLVVLLTKTRIHLSEVKKICEFFTELGLNQKAITLIRIVKESYSLDDCQPEEIERILEILKEKYNLEFLLIKFFETKLSEIREMREKEAHAAGSKGGEEAIPGDD